MTAFAVTWFDRPPKRPVEGTLFVVPADVVHQCTYLDAAASVERWVCPCGAVWARTEVHAAGTVWPAWQRAALSASESPAAAGGPVR
jgi:hypothetical protein